MKQIILIRGIPGSGKSTLAKQLMNGHLGVPLTHLEADMYFYNDMHQYVFDATKLSNAHNWCMTETNNTLNKNRGVIVSNTFTTLKELRPYFDIAKSHGIVPSVIMCQNNYGSIHNVPDEAIQRMKTRFQHDISELFNKYQI